jgi:ribosomal subunit interface protein
MQISVTGKQIDVGESLKQYVNPLLEKTIKKYFDKAIHAEVVFSKASHKHQDKFQADITMNEGAGIGFIKSRDVSDNIYSAFDGALEKIEHQLSRYKRKIKNHHKPKLSELCGYDGAQNSKAIKYILNPFEHDSIDENPEVVLEKHTDIELLSVSEAIMKMDLMELPALLFKNKANNLMNVVYHRADGKISWIDPSAVK